MQPVFKLLYSQQELDQRLPKIRMIEKRTSWNWNMNNFMARYCYNCTLLEGVSFEQHEEFKITLSLWV